jgi:protoheme IX farnesyltransferase
MLTVVRGRVTVGLQIVLYAWATVIATLTLTLVAPMTPVYAVVAIVAGAWFLVESHRLYNRAIRHTDPAPMKLFHLSNAYLTLIFLTIAVDALLPLQRF